MKTKKLQKLLIKYLVQSKKVDDIFMEHDKTVIDKLRKMVGEKQEQLIKFKTENDALKTESEKWKDLNGKLQSALEKFNSLKQNLDKAGIDVWIAIDSTGIDSDELFTYMYKKKPKLIKSAKIFKSKNHLYSEITELALPLNIEPLQCKRYRLTEVQE